MTALSTGSIFDLWKANLGLPQLALGSVGDVGAVGVPEPSSIALFGALAVAAGLWRIGRRRHIGRAR